MTWEALNNIADGSERSIVIVVNDNERSYSPTIGGMARHLATLRTTKGYEGFLDWGKSVLERTPVVGAPVYNALHGMKKGIKDFVAPQGLFEDLGLKYVGPIDGHDIAALEKALLKAKEQASKQLAEISLHIVSVEEKIYLEQLRKKLRNSLEGLKANEAMVLQLYYVEELNIYEIAEILDISTGRVSQIKSSAVKFLREDLKSSQYI